MNAASKLKVDTVIKLFEQNDCPDVHKNQLDEMLQFLEQTKGHGVVLHLRENIQGNVFNKPFQTRIFKANIIMMQNVDVQIISSCYTLTISGHIFTPFSFMFHSRGKRSRSGKYLSHVAIFKSSTAIS